MVNVAITELTDGSCTVVMELTPNNMTSLRNKRRSGRKTDHSHDMVEFYEFPLWLAAEVRDRENVHAPMSQYLQSTVDAIIRHASEVDPWYEDVLPVEPDD